MINFDNLNRVHCVGIGGIGLSAIAEILLARGIQVSGSDSKESDSTDKLIEKGAKVFLGHRDKNVKDADILVYSAAVSSDNPELVYAEQNNIPIYTRAQMLGALMKETANSIAVAGAHGKTTTTSMISLILENAKKEPTILIGGNLGEIGGNVKVGEKEYFITEACEYMDSFLSLHPRYAIILNIDSDHLDYFVDIDHIVKSFEQFANLVPEDGAVFAYDANPFVSSITKTLDRKVVTYGFHEKCNYRAVDISFNHEGMPAFSIEVDGKYLCRLELAIPGEHNITNALASFACCHYMGVDDDVIVETLKVFEGTQRRFDVLGVTTTGVKIVDDYAHHPTEITATIKAAKNIPHNDMWVLFQPHTYTRTRALHDEFAKSLAGADIVVLAEIYPAREKNIHKISSKSIVDKIKRDNPRKEVYFFEKFEDIAQFVVENAEDGDLVMTMGAGDIFKVGESILENDKPGYVR